MYMRGYLCHSKDIDQRIAIMLIQDSNRRGRAILNATAILFQTYPKFVECCRTRFLALRQRHLNRPLVIPYDHYVRPGRWYKEQVVCRLQKQEPMVQFKGTFKGRTRLIITELALYHGYRWVYNGYTRVQKTHNRKHRIYHSEDTVDPNETYTRADLLRLKIDYPKKWVEIEPGKFKWDPSEGTNFQGIMQGHVEGITLYRIAE